MAIAFDTSVLPAPSTSTWTHVCTGQNLILFVAVYSVGTGTSPSTSATYGGTSMAKIGPIGPYTGADSELTIFYLVGPIPSTTSETVY